MSTLGYEAWVAKQTWGDVCVVSIWQISHVHTCDLSRSPGAGLPGPQLLFGIVSQDTHSTAMPLAACVPYLCQRHHLAPAIIRVVLVCVTAAAAPGRISMRTGQGALALAKPITATYTILAQTCLATAAHDVPLLLAFRLGGLPWQPLHISAPIFSTVFMAWNLLAQTPHMHPCCHL